MSAAPLLVVKGMEVRYGEFLALKKISMEAAAGQTVSVIGANGAGKSSLLLAIAGLLAPCAGHMMLDGASIDGLPGHERVRRGVALVPEGRRIFSRMRVYENLLMGAYTPHLRARKGALLETVYHWFPVLKTRAAQIAGTLSGGEQQMLAIGRALMCAPRLLLCDEISLGLAPLIINELYRCLEEINRAGTTIVLVEQDITRSLKMADQVYVMLKGQIVLEGPPDRLPLDRIHRAYFGI